MSAYILEIRAVSLHGEGPVGYGVDDLGREFAVDLDLGLAADIAMALDEGQRPVIAVERGRPFQRAIPEQDVVDQMMGQRNVRAAG